jgi:hypothetical protein
MKICSECEIDYPAPLEDYFHKKSSAADGLQYVCKECIRQKHAVHYLENMDSYKDKAIKHNAEYRLRNLQYIIDYFKTHPCVDCGETDPVVLEFDHIVNKKYNIAELNHSSLETLCKEIAKCEVRCANCHRRKTAKQFNYYQGIKL